jgi:aldose 1-epimerase
MWETDTQSMPKRLVEPPELSPLDPNAVALDNNFIGWSGRALIRWPEWKAQLEMRAMGPFGCLVLYTPPRQNYFCVEPATNCSDAFNLATAGRTDTGMLTLEPEAELTGRVHLVPSLDI